MTEEASPQSAAATPAAPPERRRVAAPVALALVTLAGAGGYVAVSTRRAAPVPGGVPACAPQDVAPSTPPPPASPAGAVAEPRAPSHEGDFLVVVRGPHALETVLAAKSVARDARLPRAVGGPVAFVAGPPASTTGAPRRTPSPSGEVEFDVDGSRVVLRDGAAPATDAPDEGVVPPSALVTDVLRGVPLDGGAAGAPRLLAAVALLARGDVAAVRAALAPPADAPGARIALAYADVLARDADPAARLAGLDADADVGAVAHLLVGASLLAAGSPREARKDLDAARRARPTMWPAALLAGLACDALELPDESATAYAEVLAQAPGQPIARLSLAAARSRTDPKTSLAEIEAVLAERPAFAAGWRVLGEVRSRPGALADPDAAAKAFAAWAALRPKDPDAWEALGDAHLARAEGLRVPEALDAAADAYGHLAALRPDDAMAWFDRGAALQKAAHERGGSTGVEAFRARLLEATACYAKALARGLPREQAARAYFDLGLVLDALPSAGGDVPADLPSTPAAAFEAARGADPSFGEAPLALAAARISARDAAGAARALAEVPATADPSARGALEAAVRWLESAPASPPPPAKRGEPDALAAIARSLVRIGYQRAALALLEGEERAPERLAERVRAHAYLLEAEGVAADLARLSALDPEMARTLRAQPAVAPLLAKERVTRRRTGRRRRRPPRSTGRGRRRSGPARRPRACR